MSASWMLYALAVGALMTAAALAAEQGVRLARRPGRWVWMLAMVVSAALPLLAASYGHGLPSHFGPDAAPGASSGAQPPALAPTLVAGGLPATPSLSPRAWLPASLTGARALEIDTLARHAWQLSSVVALAFLCASAIALRRRQRGWQCANFAGAPVLVSDDTGPAVVGFLRPRIVIPAWLMGAAPARQAVVLAHEQSHIEAGDQRLLALAYLLVAAMPWNLPLWLLARRLRRAIEVDCDARVLARGYRLPEYGAALIDIGAHPASATGALPFAAPAMAEAPGFLEQRMRLMTRRPARWHKLVAPLLLLLALDIGVAAARIVPPAGQMEASTHSAAPADRVALAGYYQVGANRVAVVSVTADGLAMKTNLEPGWRLLAEGGDSYFVPGSSLRVRFDRAGATLTVSQMGVDGAPSPRADAAAVQRADAHVAARIAAGKPLPGALQIVQRNMNARTASELTAGDFSPGLAAQASTLMPLLRRRLDPYGTAQEVAFDGVSRWGWDSYKVRYLKGADSRTLTWFIWLDDDGKLALATADLPRL